MSSNIASLRDLLDSLHGQPTPWSGMLRSTAARLQEFYSQASDRIRINDIADDREAFRDYLTARKYTRNSVRSYMNYAGTLVRLARERGWKPSEAQMPIEWASIASACAPREEALLKHLMKRVGHPALVREDHFRSWAKMMTVKGRSYDWAQLSVVSMRRSLIQAGYSANFPNALNRARYGIRLLSFPETLKAEVEDVLRWKVAAFMPGRSRRAQIRPVSAEGLQNTFERLYGFAVNIEGVTTIRDLRDLINEQMVGRFIGWCLEVRHMKGRSIVTRLGQVAAALGQNPKYSNVASPWMPALIRSIPEDSEEDVIRRKQEKFLPYATLRNIPLMIRDDRPAGSKANPRTIALSVRDELLFRWILTLPWRQRNLRELRIAGEASNLRKAIVALNSSISKPDWLLEAEKTNPNIEVWQFRFNKKQTKTHYDVECVVPLSLVPLLEDYLANHRPHLLRGGDPGTLFINDRGGAFRPESLTALISTLTLRYGGKIVTPHLFRDIFAFMWLELNPQDYLTLSKLLWHRNINTTIRIYGRKFNESAALCRMERVLGL
ncbi:MAG TPA: phage integrase SAM-like domain-containing protein [Acidobacteriaceae bacterium]|nr:phage integrase SAM-like domain-containing protein [Acidobacteriaceae bacterium]